MITSKVGNMRTVRMVFEYVVAMAMVATGSALLCGQAVPESAKSASTVVSLAMQQDHVPAGQSPVAVTMRNISEHVIEETGDLDRYRVHVAGKNGEPPKTLWYRQVLGEPGIGGLAVTVGPIPREIQPGQSEDRKFRLSAFYDLSQIGEYTVYLEVRDGQLAAYKHRDLRNGTICPLAAARLVDG
jgi:hypothetical protein